MNKNLSDALELGRKLCNNNHQRGYEIASLPTDALALIVAAAEGKSKDVPDSTKLTCEIVRGGVHEKYKIQIGGADFDAEEFVESFVKPIMLSQLYHIDTVNKVLNLKE